MDDFYVRSMLMEDLDFLFVFISILHGVYTMVHI